LWKLKTDFQNDGERDGMGVPQKVLAPLEEGKGERRGGGQEGILTRKGKKETR